MKHYDPAKRRLCDRKWCRKTGTEVVVETVKANTIYRVMDQTLTVEVMVFLCGQHHRERFVGYAKA